MNAWMQLIATLLLLIALLSCTSPINKTNFERIKPGMSYQDVIAILGKPSSTTSIVIGATTGLSARWENRNGSLRVIFFNNKIKIKQFTEGVITPRER